MDFPSNPGVGETVIVFGLRGQYIILAAVSIVLFIIIAAILGNTGIPVLLVILILVLSVTGVLGGIIKINKRFGRHGVMKVMVRKRLPRYIKNTVEIYQLVKRK
ncbi:DUF4133 domain-containing protein [Massilibacteroides vaginae]|uniref:DUF4133 domain-containing protein n=1 Tax=Massilibacteroides vaginae TaxID=1673718 RepID=UPI000A1CC35E|nr:DUF4133 domain-containing protein [Massilibacteroides vaginae]